jgi:crotonobetainyl-CoA:carnitine CoA-transferase CaiB-like acyl-CoA transferase
MIKIDYIRGAVYRAQYSVAFEPADGGKIPGGVEQVPGALHGIRVVELATGIAGPMAAMLLADFGADVVKLEPPGGDPDRSRPGFAMWGRGKTSVTLDPDGQHGREHARALLDAADVCVAAPGAAARWGVSAQAATARNARLVYLSVTPYLDGAPWAGQHESNSLLSAAMGGSLRQSSHDGGPVDPVYPHLLYIQAIWAACCAAAALVEREVSGHGQVVTVGGVHGAMAASPLQMVVRSGVPDPDSAVGPGGHSLTYTRYRCADGRWLFLAALTPKFQQIALEVLDFTDLLEQAATAGLDAVVGPARRAELRPRFAAAFAGKDCADWEAAFKAAGCPVAPLAEREHWLDHPQIAAIGMAATVDDPDRGAIMMPGNPIDLSATPARQPGPAPRLRGLGQGVPDWPKQPTPDNDPVPLPGPLTGTRVLDAGVVLAGPYAGTLLAELGADVVKVEIPDGDSFRRQGFPYIRGQRGLALDLRSAVGRALFHQLARSADVVIDNYRPGVAQRLGVAYEQLRQIKPEIISLSISAFGDSGPLRDEAGFDTVLQAMSGIMTAQGGDGEPVLLTLAVNDTAAATLTAFGACVALFHRRRTGSGQRGSVSLAGASALMQCEELIRIAGRPAPQHGGPDFRGPAACDRFYRTSDGWIRVQAESPETMAALAALAGAQAFECFFAARTSAEAEAELDAAGVPATRARRSSELVTDLVLARWSVHHQISAGTGSDLHVSGRMASFSRTQRGDALVPPGVGEHSLEILTEAGLPEQAILSLIEAGVVRSGQPMTIAAMAPYR